MASEKEAWSKDAVVISPSDCLALVPNSVASFEIVNNGDKKLTYKLKATRPRSIHPDVTHGVVDGKGRVTVKISFKPKPEEAPFNAKDHLTVLVCPLGEATTSTPEEQWKLPETMKQAHRLTVPLMKK